LFKENYKNWFRHARVKIKGKGVYYSIESSRTEYTWIYKEEKTVGISKERKPDTEKATTISTINNSEVDNLINKFKQIRGL